MLHTEINLEKSLQELIDANCLDIEALVQKASDIIPPVWPLKNFIACNPLLGLEEKPFEEAIQIAKTYFSCQMHAEVNRQMIIWCSAYLDEGQATLEIPHEGKGFYHTWKELARYDSTLQATIFERKKFLSSLPSSAKEAVLYCLRALSIPLERYEEYLRAHFAALAGFSGYIKWKSEWQKDESKKPVSLLEYMAVRLAVSCLLGANTLPSFSEATPVSLEDIIKREQLYQKKLVGQAVAQMQVASHRAPVEAQLIFCIDVRSEPFRKCLEAQGNIETFGFAGFFGLPICVQTLEGDSCESYPVLLQAHHTVQEKPAQNNAYWLLRYEKGNKWLKTVRRLYQDLKYNFVTTFALAEMLGPIFAMLMAWRTIAPKMSKTVKQKCQRTFFPVITTKPEIGCLSLQERIQYAEGALRMMGFTNGFSSLIVFCGHGSAVENTPYASALDCGACGANHGGFNAKVLAAILNDQKVRHALRSKGIDIPAHTQFLGAEHNTTTDEVTLYEADGDSPEVALLRKKLDNAQALNANAQAKNHAGARCTTQAVQQAIGRSANWSEVRPEWGLARNAAFIVGPRSLTQQIDLDGRVFLHSYDWNQDPTGAFLETILTAPMVVAEWINMQYFFSALDPVFYGSGSKVTQNVLGKLGVMQGNASDLMHGLPLQSVQKGDESVYHEPMRLLALVYAPRQKIEEIIERQAVLQKLFYNGWVKLIALDPTDGRAYQLDRQGRWQDAA